MNLNKDQENTIHKIIINYEVKQEGNLAVLCLTPSGVKIYINQDGSINHEDNRIV